MYAIFHNKRFLFFLIKIQWKQGLKRCSQEKEGNEQDPDVATLYINMGHIYKNGKIYI